MGAYVLSRGYRDEYYVRAQRLRDELAGKIAGLFGKYDLLLTPTAPTTAFAVGEKLTDPVKMYATDICTVAANIAGIPAISVPCGADSRGMPIGMQLMAGKREEKKLVGAAYAYERAAGFGFCAGEAFLDGL